MPDTTMAEVGRGMALSQAGERDAARRVLEALWEDIGGEDGDPLHRCAIAHAMADVQDDPADELTWDLRALAAADLVSDGRAAEAGMAAPAAALYPRCTSTWASATASSASRSRPASTCAVVWPRRARCRTTATGGWSARD